MNDIRPQLGAHAAALIEDNLASREEAIMKAAIAKLPNLSPQDALTAIIEIAAGRKLLSSLIRRAETEKARLASLS